MTNAMTAKQYLLHFDPAGHQKSVVLSSAGQERVQPGIRLGPTILGFGISVICLLWRDSSMGALESPG